MEDKWEGEEQEQDYGNRKNKGNDKSKGGATAIQVNVKNPTLPQKMR
jgi:hypothetical protein